MEAPVCSDQEEHDTILQHAGKENQEHPWEGGTPVLLDNGVLLQDAKYHRYLFAREKTAEFEKGRLREFTFSSFFYFLS